MKDLYIHMIRRYAVQRIVMTIAAQEIVIKEVQTSVVNLRLQLKYVETRKQELHALWVKISGLSL